MIGPRPWSAASPETIAALTETQFRILRHLRDGFQIKRTQWSKSRHLAEVLCITAKEAGMNLSLLRDLDPAVRGFYMGAIAYSKSTTWCFSLDPIRAERLMLPNWRRFHQGTVEGLLRSAGAREGAPTLPLPGELPPRAGGGGAPSPPPSLPPPPNAPPRAWKRASRCRCGRCGAPKKAPNARCCRTFPERARAALRPACPRCGMRHRKPRRAARCRELSRGR